MKNFNLVSIIVPAYNTERLLDRCIESIVNQSYKDIEIILVDDGSTDHTSALCDSWALKDKRIKVIHKANAGVSSARNVGLDNASGYYIAFVDSDDYIDENMIERLIEAYKNCEFAVCGIYYNDYSAYADNESIITASDSVDLMLTRNRRAFFNGFVWNKLYLHSIIRSKNIRFDETVSFLEDILFNLKYLNEISNVSILNEALYHYIYRENSAMNGIKIDKRLESLYVIRELYKIVNINNLDSLVNWSYIFLVELCNTISLTTANSDEYNEASAIINRNLTTILKSKSINRYRKLQCIFIAKFKFLYKYLYKIVLHKFDK